MENDLPAELVNPIGFEDSLLEGRSLIEVKNVTFIVQGKTLVKEFTHDFIEGRTTALVGPSGSGKSTVLKLSAGLLVPSFGDVLYKGCGVHRMTRRETLDFRREAAVVFQDSALWANQSLYQNLELPLRIHFPDMDRDARDERIREVCTAVGYRRELGIRPAALSMGEQKLIGFARAMLCRPSHLYLDEWTESLDETSAQRLVRLVRAHQDAGGSVIFVSHDLRIIKELADTIIMMQDGQTKLILTSEMIATDSEIAEYLEKGMA